MPELLPAATIQAILRKARQNLTYKRGERKYKYLLGGLVFCKQCGHSLFGRVARKTLRYYRHSPKLVIPCTCPKGVIVADQLEENVMRSLCETFLNPKAVQRAIEAATPNRDKVKELQAEREHVLKRLSENEANQERLRGYAADGTFTKEEIIPRRDKLRQTADKLQQQLATLDAQLEHVPNPDAIQDAAKKIAKYIDPKLVAKYSNYSQIPWAEKRALAEKIMGGVTPDGRRMGVYISWLAGDNKPRKWRYSILGAISESMLVPRSLASLKKQDEFDPAYDLGEEDYVVASAKC